MSESALTVVDTRQEVELGTLHASSAGALVAGASAMATTLADVIDRQGLFNKISGRKHVRVEGWTTLAAMLGCTPREVSNEAQADGSYVATVELVRMRDGAVISRATSECGMDEATWAGRPRYARRSMAATRATGKACRLAFSWIMTLAGYDATPYEEMPERQPTPPVERDVTPPKRAAAQEEPAAPRSPSGHDGLAGDGTWPVGKYRGKQLADLPQKFLEWAVENMQDKPKLMQAASNEIDRRAAMEEKAGASADQDSIPF